MSEPILQLSSDQTLGSSIIESSDSSQEKKEIINKLQNKVTDLLVIRKKNEKLVKSQESLKKCLERLEQYKKLNLELQQKHNIFCDALGISYNSDLGTIKESIQEMKSKSLLLNTIQSELNIQQEFSIDQSEIILNSIQKLKDKDSENNRFILKILRMLGVFTNYSSFDSNQEKENPTSLLLEEVQRVKDELEKLKASTENFTYQQNEICQMLDVDNLNETDSYTLHFRIKGAIKNIKSSLRNENSVYQKKIDTPQIVKTTILDLQNSTSKIKKDLFESEQKLKQTTNQLHIFEKNNENIYKKFNCSSINEVAQNYEELMKIMNVSNPDYLRKTIRQMKDDNLSLQTQSNELNSKIESIQNNNQTLNNQLLTIQDQLNCLRSKLNESEAKKLAYKEELKELKSKLNSIKMEIKTISIERNNLRGQLTDKNEEIISLKEILQNEKGNLKIHFDEMENQILSLKQKCRENKQEADSNRFECENLQKNYNLLLQQNKTIKDEKQNLEIDLENNKSQLNNLNKEIRMKSDELETLKTKNINLKQKNQSFKDEIDELTTDKNNLKRKINDLNNQIDSLHREKSQFLSQFQIEQKENQSLKSKMSQLESQDFQQKSEIDNLKKINQDLSNKCNNYQKQESQFLLKISDYEQNNQELKLIIDETKSENDSFKSQINLLNSEIETLKNENFELKKNENQRTKNSEDLKSKISQLINENSILKRTNEENNQIINQMKKDQSTYCKLLGINSNSSVSSITESISDLLFDNKGMYSENQNMKQQLQSISTLLNIGESSNPGSIQNAINSLYDEIQQYENEIDKINLELNSMKQTNKKMCQILNVLTTESLIDAISSVQATVNQIKHILNVSDDRIIDCIESLHESIQTLCDALNIDPNDSWIDSILAMYEALQDAAELLGITNSNQLSDAIQKVLSEKENLSNEMNLISEAIQKWKNNSSENTPTIVQSHESILSSLCDEMQTLKPEQLLSEVTDLINQNNQFCDHIENLKSNEEKIFSLFGIEPNQIRTNSVDRIKEVVDHYNEEISRLKGKIKTLQSNHDRKNSLNSQAEEFQQQNENFNQRLNELNLQKGDLNNKMNNMNQMNEELQGKINNFSQMNEELQGKVNNFSQMNEELQGRVSNLNQTNEELQGRMNNMNQMNEELQGKVANLSQINDEFQNKIDNMNQTNQELQDKMNNMSQMNEELQGTVTNLNQTNQELQDKMNNMSQMNEELQGKVNNLNQTNQELQDKMNNMSQMNEELQDKVTNLNQTNEELQNRVNNFSQMNEELQNKVTNLSQINDEFQNKIDNMNQTNQELQDKMNNMSQLNDELQGKVSNLNQTNQELQDKMNNMSQLNEELQGKVTNLNQTNEELQNKVNNFSQMNEELQGQINNMSQMNEELQGKVTNLNQTNEELQNKVTNLSQMNEEQKEQTKSLEKQISDICHQLHIQPSENQKTSDLITESIESLKKTKEEFHTFTFKINRLLKSKKNDSNSDDENSDKSTTEILNEIETLNELILDLCRLFNIKSSDLLLDAAKKQDSLIKQMSPLFECFKSTFKDEISSDDDQQKWSQIIQEAKKAKQINDKLISLVNVKESSELIDAIKSIQNQIETMKAKNTEFIDKLCKTLEITKDENNNDKEQEIQKSVFELKENSKASQKFSSNLAKLFGCEVDDISDFAELICKSMKNIAKILKIDEKSPGLFSSIENEIKEIKDQKDSLTKKLNKDRSFAIQFISDLNISNDQSDDLVRDVITKLKEKNDDLKQLNEKMKNKQNESNSIISELKDKIAFYKANNRKLFEKFDLLSRFDSQSDSENEIKDFKNSESLKMKEIFKKIDEFKQIKKEYQKSVKKNKDLDARIKSIENEIIRHINQIKQSRREVNNIDDALANMKDNEILISKLREIVEIPDSQFSAVVDKVSKISDQLSSETAEKEKLNHEIKFSNERIRDFEKNEVEYKKLIDTQENKIDSLADDVKKKDIIINNLNTSLKDIFRSLGNENIQSADFAIDTIEDYKKKIDELSKELAILKPAVTVDNAFDKMSINETQQLKIIKKKIIEQTNHFNSAIAKLQSQFGNKNQHKEEIVRILKDAEADNFRLLDLLDPPLTSINNNNPYSNIHIGNEYSMNPFAKQNADIFRKRRCEADSVSKEEYNRILLNRKIITSENDLINKKKKIEMAEKKISALNTEQRQRISNANQSISISELLAQRLKKEQTTLF